MSKNTVSVIIPCYNGERFLAETIESVLSQSYQNFEIVVIDDGSSDNTKGIAARYSSVRYIYQDNQGNPVARNRGIAESKGSYLVFLDQDDRLLPETLDVGVNYLNIYPDCAFVFGWFRSIGADGSLLSEHRIPLETANYQTLLEGTILVPIGTVMFQRTMVESVGGFRPSIWPSEDYDLYLRIARVFPIYCHNQVVFEYRQHESNSSSSIIGPKVTLENNLQRLDEQLPYIKGNKDYEAAYRYGKQHWRNLIGPWVVGQMITFLKRGQLAKAVQVMLFLLRNYPLGSIKQLVELLSKRTKRFVSLLHFS